ncbi:MAG: ester cyclase [Acetobacteraceae bacterium]|nr:ester cyclase [Acetobacteraceae bacterium]
MSADELRAFLDHYVLCLNKRSIDELAVIIADELTHNGQIMTRQQWWEGPVGQHLAAVPDQTWTIEDVVIAGNRIAVRYEDSGTPTGRWIGLEPTGARIRFREYAFYTVSGGLITDVWSVFDSETVRRQLSPDLPASTM